MSAENRAQPNAALSHRAALLEGPIAKRLLTLAWPVLVVLALQTFEIGRAHV